MLSLALVLALLALCWGYAWLGLRWTNATTTDPPRQFAAVDGLRGMLALSVFVHHAVCTHQWYVTGTWNAGGDRVFEQAGTAAVVLFLFITGFLFWGKLQRQPRVPLVAHVKSRVLRLAPAYLAAIAVMMLVVGLHTGWRLLVSPGRLLNGIFNWVVFALPGQSDVNGLKDTSQILAGVVWTLRLEWVFYALVPFLGWFAGGLWRTTLLLGLFFAAEQLLKFVANGLPAEEPHRLLDLGIEAAHHLARTFAGGIAVAALLPWARIRWPKVDFSAAGFSTLSVGLVLGVFLCLPPEHNFPEVLVLMLPFGLIVLGNDWFGFLTSRPTLLLGRISYSIYLLHGLVLHLFFFALNRVVPVASIPTPAYWAIIAALGAVVIAVAARWYRCFEAPFVSRRA